MLSVSETCGGYMNRSRASQVALEQAILGVLLRDRIINGKIRRTEITDVSKRISSFRWQWVARKTIGHWGWKVLERSRIGKRSIRHPSIWADYLVNNADSRRMQVDSSWGQPTPDMIMTTMITKKLLKNDVLSCSMWTNKYFLYPKNQLVKPHFHFVINNAGTMRTIYAKTSTPQYKTQTRRVKST